MVENAARGPVPGVSPLGANWRKGLTRNRFHEHCEHTEARYLAGLVVV